MDRRQGQFEKAIQEFSDAIMRDPHNSVFIEDLASTLYMTRQFRAAEQMFDRLIELRPDQPILRVQKPLLVTFNKTGDDTAARSAIAALPASMADDRSALTLRLNFALVDRDWPQAKQLNQKVQKAPENAQLLSQLAVVDALLNNKEVAISEAKRAIELLPISKDALDGPSIEINLAVAYAWTNEPGLAFEKLSSLTKVPNWYFLRPIKA